MDGGKVFPTDSGRAAAARSGPGDGTYARGPNRIDEEIASASLQEDRGVIDERDTQLRALDRLRGNGRRYIIHKRRRRLRAGGRFPAYGVEQSASLGRCRIEEAAAVEMFFKLQLCLA